MWQKFKFLASSVIVFIEYQKWYTIYTLISQKLYGLLNSTRGKKEDQCLINQIKKSRLHSK